jgi:ribonuclease BN (tRNA processing enzyme)
VLLTWARGVDVLVHEVVNMSRIDGRFPGGADIKTYMRTAHTPVEKLAQIAARTNPRVLVLTHIVPAGTSEPDMIKGIQAAGYRGRVAFGHDLDRF